jgi:hypothetical protein
MLVNGRSLAERVPWTRDQLLAAIWLVAAVALGLSPKKGADYPRYAQWVDAFATLDILKIKSTALSPVGVPVTHWSHAPGLVTHALDRVLSLLPFVEGGLHTVSWLVALAFWWAFIGLARLVTRGDATLIALAVGAAFVGTHAGFYSTYHSSEIFSLASFTIATFWALSAEPGRVRDSFLIGVACGLLLTVRLNLLMYLPLPLAARAFVVWRGQGGRWSKALVWHAIALGFPLLAAGVQLLLFNYWMTGSPAHSPYVYGDESFHSVDLAHPMFGTMLFHAWHGLLTYHPLFLLGPIALIALILRRDLPVGERFLAGCALLSVLAHVYLQASWWCWWMGTGTFGCRTLAVSGVVVVIALVRWLQLLLGDATPASRATAAALLSFSLAACGWSFLLFLQGNSNFTTYEELLLEQRKIALEPSVLVPVAVTLLLGLGYGIVAFRQRHGRALLTTVTACVAGLAAQGLLAELLQGWLTDHGVPRLAPALLGVVSALAFALTVRLTTQAAAPNLRRLPRTAVAAALLWVFVAGSWAFARFAIETKHAIASEAAQERHYRHRYRAAMVVDDLVDSLPEYDRVDGFTKRKAAARRYIEAAAKAAAREARAK